ncbi:MAG: bifunctional diaminohydroxyphosphoribosylaminopyrimidine deaminase/5-amino-6-(5-phosphoribosylamino)uracil reductase RibD [Fibrobacter sp.]|nr:bifunctional diaminohydroxyphosphoribosylaminopyrimidine deaminase/5-amino-6-(5-phosphoribosylamino)uracil reductase RibD [Fibrobacter sp.]
MTAFSEKDILFMREALKLANAAKGKTFPNPAVGAVIVSEGKIVGKGATQVYGGPHAEKIALKDAGSKANGATLYVTLEPCCHYGRTPPCTDAIVAAGIKKVVLSVKDPNPLVAGRGIRQLRSMGIIVNSGLLRKDALELNEDFFFSIVAKRAWVTLKLALTLDGMIADESGGSKWITGEKARLCVQEQRRIHAAIAVGKSTLNHDNPQLTIRHKSGYNPARIIFSSSKEIPRNTYFFQHRNETRSIVVISGGIPWTISRESGIEYWYTGEADEKVQLTTFLKMAFAQNIPSIFIEGGQIVASKFLENGLVNRLHLFYGQKILGGGKKSFAFKKGMPINNSIILNNTRHQILDGDILVSGTPEIVST